MEITYQLQYPIVQKRRTSGDAEVREETISEVTVGRPRAKHLKALDKVEGKFSQSLALISACTGLPAATVDELDATDIEGLGEIIGDFLPKSLQTGETS